MAGPFSECSTEIIGESYVPSLEQHSAITRAQRRPRQEHAWTHTNHSSVYCSDSLTFSSDVVFFETCLDLAVRSAYMGHGSGLAFVPLSSGSIPQDQLETQLHPSMAVFRGAVEPANTSFNTALHFWHFSAARGHFGSLRAGSYMGAEDTPITIGMNADCCADGDGAVEFLPNFW